MSNFHSLLANEKMKANLDAAVESGRIFHAYMLCGENGSGKKTAAELMARAFVGGKPMPLKSPHPDIIHVIPKKDKRAIDIETIRTVRKNSIINPITGQRKIYILHSAHTLSNECQNALLSVLEQPCLFAVFILLCNSKINMLSTILSRCICYEMSPVPAEIGLPFISGQLSDKNKVEESEIIAALQSTNGNLGKTIEILKGGLFSSCADMICRIYKDISEGNQYDILTEVTKLDKKRFDVFLKVFRLYTRDIITFKMSGRRNSIVFLQSILQNEKIFVKIKVPKLFEIIENTNGIIKLAEQGVSLKLLQSVFVAGFEPF